MSDLFQKLLDGIKGSSKAITVLPTDIALQEALKENYQINNESLLGVILENTGGIIIDNWIRLYGAGELDFIARNKLFPFNEIVIGEDIIGGLFLCLDNGNIGYFAPDCLNLEDMGVKLEKFIYWCFYGDTDTYYVDYRWQGWEKDTSILKNSEGISFYPFLWMNAESLNSRSRKVVPMVEIIKLELEFLENVSNNS